MKLHTVLQKFGRTQRELSVHSVLENLVGVENFARIASLTPDRRELTCEVARQLGLPEDFVLERLSQELSIPFIRSIPMLDTHALPIDVRLADLVRLACVPVFSAGSVRSLACVDPLLTKPMLRFFPNAQPVLATWTCISGALHDAERRVQRAQAAAEPEGKYVDAAQRVLAAIVSEVESLGGYSCAIREEAGELSYQFDLPDGRRGKGKINSRVGPALRHSLSKIGRGDVLTRRPDGSTVLVEAAKIELQNFGVFFRWGKLEQDVSVSICAAAAPSNVVPFPQPKVDPVATSDPAPSIRKPCALIVDDNQTFGRVLERYLARFDIEVRRAEHAEAGFNLLANPGDPIDLVICDVHMPGMKGGEFLKRIRGDSRLKRTPVIMLTSDHDIETELRLLSDGADVFICKNEDPRLLGVHLQRMLAKIKEQQAA